VAHACNLATWRLGSLNGLRAGFLGAAVLCRSGVRAKFGASRSFRLPTLPTHVLLRSHRVKKDEDNEDEDKAVSDNKHNVHVKHGCGGHHV